MKIPIQVTSEDIAAAEGRHGEYHACPVAQCLMRLGYENIQVDSDYILASKEGKAFKYKTPTVAQVFIDDFDDVKKVAPVNFELSDPQIPVAEDYFCNRWPSKKV